MRVLVIGRGSMGKRRIRDLTALGVSVDSWDITDEGPWAPLWNVGEPIIVSTPPMRKSILAGVAAAKNAPCFIEADVEAVKWPHYPSATPLFTDWYAEISKWAYMVGYILHVGQHIDDWHPGADPETYYAYRDETGPTREMIPFELIWLTKLFGPVTLAQGRTGKEIASIVVTHQFVTGVVVIDALSRPAVRRFTGIGYAGWQRSIDLVYTESAYLEEMRAFVDVVQGRGTWPYSQSEEAANLGVLRMIEPVA